MREFGQDPMEDQENEGNPSQPGREQGRTEEVPADSDTPEQSRTDIPQDQGTLGAADASTGNERADDDGGSANQKPPIPRDGSSNPAQAGGLDEEPQDPWDAILASANQLKAVSQHSEKETAAKLDEALQEIEEENKRSQQEKMQQKLFETTIQDTKFPGETAAPKEPPAGVTEQGSADIPRYDAFGRPVQDAAKAGQSAQEAGREPNSPSGTGSAGQGEAPSGYPPVGSKSPYRTGGVPPVYGTQPPYVPLNRQDTTGFSAIPPEYAQPKKRNIGLRVFCVLLALLLISTVGITVGYYLGRDEEERADGIFPPQTSSDFLEGLPDSSEPAENNELPPNVGNIGGDVNVPIHDKPSGDPFTAAESAKKVTASVVGIAVYSLSDTSSGSAATGVILSEDGYILTNDHVYSGIANPQFIIILSDGSKLDAEFVAGDVRSDLAVLKADASGLQPAEFGNSDQLDIGETVITIGNPGGMSLAGTVTMGIVSGVNRRVYSDASSYSMKCIQTDAAINPGNSGGPLINLYGQVVGINSSKIMSSGYEGIGFAIPSVTAKNILDSLVQYGYVHQRAKLGITYTTVDIVAARQNNISSGLYINSVSAESDLSGKVVSGEMITHINGNEIVLGSEVLDVIEASRSGDEVTLTVYSKQTDKERTVVAKLIEDRGASSYNSLPEEPDTSSDPFEDFFP